MSLSKLWEIVKDRETWQSRELQRVSQDLVTQQQQQKKSIAEEIRNSSRPGRATPETEQSWGRVGSV